MPAYLAAPTDCNPAAVNTSPVNENIGFIDSSLRATRAYELADSFRSRGIPVVLGGMHPSCCPEEALSHADAVVVGEAEGVWPDVVAAAQRGNLQGVYRRSGFASLSALKRPRRELLSRGRYATLNAVQATRGCPHHCSFCSVSAYSQHTQRQRPSQEVVEEIRSFPERFFLFGDDNLTADPVFASALMVGLKPLLKRLGHAEIPNPSPRAVFRSPSDWERRAERQAW